MTQKCSVKDCKKQASHLGMCFAHACEAVQNIEHSAKALALPARVALTVVPFEAALVAGFTMATEGIKLLGKIIDSQSKEQQAQSWDRWLTTTQPLFDLIAHVNSLLKKEQGPK